MTTFEFIVHGVGITSVGFAGLLANIVCLLVLNQPALRRGRQGSVNVLLTSMAAIDFVLLLCSVLLFGLPAITDHLMLDQDQANETSSMTRTAQHVLIQMIPWTYSIGMGAQTASVYITVVVTIERWLAVCYPLMSRSICSRGRARKAVMAVLIFSLVYNITRFWEYRAENNSVNPTSLRLNEAYRIAYITVLYMLVIFGGPLVLLVVLNIRIGLTIHRARLQRNTIAANSHYASSERHGGLNNSRHISAFLLNGSRRTRERLEENEQQNLAIMLMVVVLIFVLCNVLAMVANILDLLNFNAGALTKISNLLVTLNSSVNLFIYCGFGRKFRRELKKLFHLADDPPGAAHNRQAGILRAYWRPADHPLDNTSSLLMLANDNINIIPASQLEMTSFPPSST